MTTHQPTLFTPLAHLRRELAHLRRELADLRDAYEADTIGSFGFPNRARMCRELAGLDPADYAVFVVDGRKIHEQNIAWPYSTTTERWYTLLSLSVRRAPGRPADRIYQIGGDEWAIVVPRADARGFLARLLQEAARATCAIPAAERERLRALTGGLVWGMHMAIVGWEAPDDLIEAISWCADQVTRLKSRPGPGSDRATSGVAGTVVAFRARARAIG